MIKQWLRKWLGYNELEGRMVQAFRRLNTTIDEIKDHNADAVCQQRIINRALGKIIAKVDPIYAQDEMSSDRKAASDAIADQVMGKLASEHYVSTKLTGGR